MKKKLLALTLLTITTTFATPISTPNNINDTPIISNGSGAINTNNGSGQCKAYQRKPGYGNAYGFPSVSLSGGETLVFYGSGSEFPTAGGYLSTKSSYSGTAYLMTSTTADKDGSCQYDTQWCYISIDANSSTDSPSIGWDLEPNGYSGSDINLRRYTCKPGISAGLFTKFFPPEGIFTDTGQHFFIAGVGAGGGSGSDYDIWCIGKNECHLIYTYYTGGSGGGWIGGSGTWRIHKLIFQGLYNDSNKNHFRGTLVLQEYQYETSPGGSYKEYQPSGFLHAHAFGFGPSVYIGGGGASSISAFYDYPPKSYTSASTSFTILGGGLNKGDPILYVCK